MPAVTSLAFHREKQTINSYDHERPKSLSAFRLAAKEALDEVDRELTEIEAIYLQPHATHEEFIHEHMLTLKNLFNATQHTQGIRRKVDFDIIIEKVGSLGERTDLYKEHVENMKGLAKLILTMNPDSLVCVTEKVQKVLNYMDKYCLSFYNGPQQICPDPYLETPFSYHTKRKDRIRDVQKCLKMINEKAQKFNSVGVTLDDFSTHTEQLARRADCRSVLCFLLFPESCRMVREARDVLLAWLEEDKEYVEGLANDVRTMNEEENEMKKKRGELYNSMVCQRHQLHLLQKRHDELETLLQELLQRKASVEDEYHEALVEVKKVELHLQKAKLRLSELRHNASQYSQHEFRASVREQQKLVRENTLAMPERQKTTLRVEDKLAWFKDREETLRQLKSEISQSERQLTKLMAQLRSADEQLKHLQKMKVVMKNVYGMKHDVGTLKKIFHNLQMESRLKFLSARQASLNLDIQHYLPQDDHLTAAIRLTSQYIDKDWFRLYFLLPFHPPRGLADVEDDVKKISLKYVRGSLYEHALESLNTWRRLHTRANLASLLQALKEIDKTDIVEKIQKRLERIQREQEGFLPPIQRPVVSPTSRLLQKQKALTISPVAEVSDSMTK